MGGYLPKPITEKESSDFEGDKLICGASSMQGWRATQEDDHNCFIKYDENASLFAVYDGHGGHEVAEYAAKHFPDYLKETEAYKAGDYEKALIDAFLGFDATLATPAVISILKQIACSKDKNSVNKKDDKTGEQNEDDDEEEDEEENLARLREEAVMPLNLLIDGYRLESNGRLKFNSPALKQKKSGASTSGAGASSSSEANGGDGEVSSSSCSGSKKPDAPSTTSLTNGDVEMNGEVSNDGVSGGSSEPPGSSSDKCNGETPLKTPESALGSGDCGNDSAKDDLPDSSSQAQGEDKNVTSSNGEVSDTIDEAEKKITSSSPEKSGLHKRSATLTRKLLCSPGEDSDSSSEDDEMFEGGPEESSDDEEDDKIEGEGDDDDDDDDDDDEEDVDEEEEGEVGYSEEQPGSDSGCTAVVALLVSSDLYVANAGDSRCVVCRDGQAVDMSIDHKPEDRIEMVRIVAAGGMVSSDGRVNGGLNLSRALGDHTYKQVTTLPATEQMITALPDIKKLEIDPVKDEFIVLACDGIWNFMSSQDVVDYIRPKLNEKKEKVSTICEELFDHCLAPDTMGDGTGCDNMTCIIVKLKSSGINGHEPVKRPAASMEDTTIVENKSASVKRQKLDNETVVADTEVSVDK